MKLRCLLFGIIVWSLLPRGAVGQQPDLESVRDSLAGITDVVLLRRLESQLPLPGSAPTVEPLVRRGLIALRLYGVTTERDEWERARDVFQGAVVRFPAEPWSHYGLALALAGGPDARLPLVGGVVPQVTVAQSVAEIFGRDGHSRARRALRAALAEEPGFGPAAVLLADLAMADGRRRELVDEARTALLTARAAGADSPAVARALADMEAALGNYAAAAAAAGGGGNDAGALRSRAIALLLQQGSRAEGFATYRSALEALDGPAAALFYQDLAVLVDEPEAADWKRARGPAQQRLWLERFWERRAAEGGVTPEERITEHYRRQAQARSQYVRNSRRGSESPTGGALLVEQSPEGHIFDDRGVVLIRHGPPDHAVRTGAPGVLPNETWAYQLPGRDDLQLFHFVALRSAQDFSLVADILDAVDPEVVKIEKAIRAQVGAGGLAGRSVPADLNTQRDLRRREVAVMSLFEDRATLDPRYRQGLSRLRVLVQNGEPLDGTEIRSITERQDAVYRQGARQALRTDTYTRSYSGPVAFHHDVFAFRNPFGRTELTAAVAAPAAQLEPQDGTDRRAYDLAISVILHDTLQDVITRLDTVQQVRLAAPPGPGDFIRAHVSLPVVPSEHTTYRLVVADAIGDRGSMTTGGNRIRDFGGPRLTLSDAVLASADSAGDWRRGSARLALALPRSFGEGRPFTVFYEIYNLPAETPYQTRVVVTPTERRGLLDRVRGVFGADGGRLDLRYDDVALPDADGTVQELRQLASDLGAGRYRLEITVTNRSTGENATTRTEFTVVD